MGHEEAMFVGLGRRRHMQSTLAPGYCVHQSNHIQYTISPNYLSLFRDDYKTVFNRFFRRCTLVMRFVPYLVLIYGVCKWFDYTDYVYNAKHYSKLGIPKDES